MKTVGVNSYKEISQKIDEGTKNRTVASTNMNATSRYTDPPLNSVPIFNNVFTLNADEVNFRKEKIGCDSHLWWKKA